MSKTGSKAQSKQIMTLQRQLDQVKKKVKTATQFRQYNISDHTTLEGTGLNVEDVNYSVINLVQPGPQSTGSSPHWEPIFQSPNGHETLSPNKFRGRSMGLEIMYQLGDPANATSPITATTFLCSLRKEAASQFIENTDHGANMKNGVHFFRSKMTSLLPTGQLGQGPGMVFLNKGIFKIHAIRRWDIGGKTNFQALTEPPQDDVAVTTSLEDNQKRFYIKHPYRNLLKSSGPPDRTTTTTGGFRTLNIETVENTDQLYLFTFANCYGDQELSISYSAIFTGVTSN